ncbi:MAG: hypothetical protein LBN93_07605 [Candidatus Symbiothrix sp.]|jgi:hypothetical protein|nr:hypothetical protein [Candidatus Symbiothrix sp.]
MKTFNFKRLRIKSAMTVALAVTCVLVTGNCSPVTAQVAIGSVNDSITPGALLDLSQATDAGGLLLPQIESADTLIEELKKPGMLVYNKTDGKFYTYNGSAWKVGSSGGGSSPAGACEDYIAGSWQTGRLCWYPVDNSASIAYDAAMTTGCPLWWRVPTYSELRIFADPTTLADYPLPDGFTLPTTGVYWSSNVGFSDSKPLINGWHVWRSYRYAYGFNAASQTVVLANVAGIVVTHMGDLDSSDFTPVTSVSNKLRCIRDI